jgi:hypothetical protein
MVLAREVTVRRPRVRRVGLAMLALLPVPVVATLGASCVGLWWALG